MLSTVIVIGASVIFFTLIIADSRSIQRRSSRHILRVINLTENQKASQNYEHWKPIQRAISTMELEGMTSYYDPEFVVLSRCDDSSGYCRKHGANFILRPTRTGIETVRVWFLDVQTEEVVSVDLVNHTECQCDKPSKSGQNHLWHKVIYHVEIENSSTNIANDLGSTEEAPIAITADNNYNNNNNSSSIQQHLISYQQHLTTSNKSLEFPSNATNRMDSGAHTSSTSANMLTSRLHFKTILILLIMLTYNYRVTFTY